MSKQDHVLGKKNQKNRENKGAEQQENIFCHLVLQILINEKIGHTDTDPTNKQTNEDNQT